MEHFYLEIPGFFHARYLYGEMVRTAKDGAHFVEIGAWLGQSTVCMAVEIINSGKQITFDVIDCFPDEMPDVPMFDAWLKKHGNSRPHFERNIEPVKDYVNVIQMDSAEAAKRYFDHSLDFVYVDGDHSLEGVRRDLDAWAPKIKPGGVFAGDDFGEHGVAKAVFERYPNPSTVMDSGFSWMVVT